MTTTYRARPVLRRRFWSLPHLLFAAAAVCVAGCARPFMPGGTMIPAPANALAAAPLSGDRIAVLAGNDDSKGVFIVDASSGHVKRSFGVTREANGLIAATPGGPLLLSIGGERDGRRFGAVEAWSLDGAKRHTVALSSQASGIAGDGAGTAYVLLRGERDARAAVAVQTRGLRAGAPFPLGGGARALAFCGARAGDFLLYTAGDNGRLTIRNVTTGEEFQSPLAAEGATCPPSGDVAYAITGGPLSRSIAVLKLPELSRITSIAASSDALALYETGDRRLLALNSTPHAATLELFNEGSTTVAQSGNVAAATR